MKVKIGDKIYDSSKEPIMIMLSEEDKVFISNMDKDNTKYCSYPDESNLEDVIKFMEIE